MSRILVITNSYYPERGGLQELVRQFRDGMVRRGISCDILTNGSVKSLNLQFNRCGFILCMPLSNPFSSRVMEWITNAIQCSIIKCLMKRVEYDSVFVHFPDHINRFHKLDVWEKQNLYVVFHGDDILRYKGVAPFDEDFLRLKKFLLNATELVAVSEYLRDEARFILDQESLTFRVIHNGITFSEKELCSKTPSIQREDAYKILFVGRLVQDKGVDLLIDSMAYLTDLNLQLTIVGEGVERQNLIAQVRKKGLFEVVSFLGGKDRAEVLDMMMASDLVVIPSRRETFGIVLLEAMAHGSKVVCTNVGGMKSLFERDFGIQIENLDANVLADAIREVISSESAPLNSSIQSLRRRFSSERMIDNYLELS